MDIIFSYACDIKKGYGLFVHSLDNIIEIRVDIEIFAFLQLVILCFVQGGYIRCL